MQAFRTIIIGTMLAIVIVLMPGHTIAQQTTAGPPNQAETQAAPVEVVTNHTGIKIKLNFQDAPLQTVLEYLSGAAGLTIISDEPISDGRMTVISRQPIPLDEAISLINSILKQRSLTTVLMGKTLKVVTLEKAKTENVPVFSGQNPDVIVPSDDVVHYVIPVSHVSATSLKENLKALLPEYASLEANEDGNALIITDTTANIKRIMQIIKALDTHMATVAEIRVFRLINADATSAATLINSMFQQEQSNSSRNRQGARGPMEMMMQGMRGGPGGGPGGRGSPGGRGNSSNDQSQGGGLNVQVVAAADDRTNSVVVRGPAESLDVVEGMIKQLEDTTAKVAGVKIFQLRYADAMNTADMINQLFGDEQSSSQNQRSGGPMMFRGPGGPNSQMQQNDETGSAARVAAAADSQTNTVVVTGPDNLLEIVAQVVKNLDTQLPNVADVKVFHLEYADAQDTADLINEVFGESRTSSQTTRSSGRQNQQVQFMRGGPGGFPGMQQTTQSGGASDVAIIASADSRTNSVVVSGPTETLQIITQVIKELDENPEQERKIFVYALKNANATNLKEIINNLFAEIQALNQTGSTTGQQFQGQQRGGQQTAFAAQGSSSTESGTNDLSEDTYLEADTDTNSLLVLTSSRNYELLRPIIDELDKPVGQVLIKVLFAEITHSDDLDLGTEFSVWNLRGAAGDSNNVEFSTRFPPTQTSGITATVLDKTLNVTIRALQETGKLNILSRPYILTSNNQTATITVGQQVPYATGESLTNGQSQTTTEYRDIGIILEVTPSINPDGLVNMTVRPEISSTTGENVQISENLSLPVFATRSSETKVAIHDGQTIVIGGLMQDEVHDNVSKVPLLGDIPLLGNLFKRTIKTKDKTELLIFLTPHVAPDAQALVPISDRERLRSNLSNDESIRDIYRKHMQAMENTDVNEPKQ
ncbi:MAG: secretin N-terminal domain-containing protein [Sedimentisphaerales bacterium]|jgi:general secretion pathway protein D